MEPGSIPSHKKSFFEYADTSVDNNRLHVGFIHTGEASLEKERKRIAQELHDNVNQLLATAKLYMEMMPPVIKKEVDLRTKGIEYLERAIEEIRGLSGELAGCKTNKMELTERIRLIADDTAFAASMKINFIHSGEIGSLPTDKQATLLRIVQEQIKNIVKHSKASKVDIGLELCNREVVLAIKDNGVGFDPRQHKKGIGLCNIFDRAQRFNGYAAIQAAKGKGCSLLVILPA